MEKLCLIVSGGAFAPLPEDLRAPDFVIACDRGWQYAARLGVTPDLIVGDFDSAAAPRAGAPVERLPTRKDDTDTMYAARRATELGYRNVAVCCAFGGRLDHTLANIQTAAWIAARSRSGIRSSPARSPRNIRKKRSCFSARKRTTKPSRRRSPATRTG